MKTVAKSLVAAALLFAPACGGEFSSDPQPPLQTITNELEVLGGSPPFIDLDSYKARINSAFGNAAAINFTLRRASSFLDGQWQYGDPDDPDNGDVNRLAYQDAARRYRNVDGVSPFGVFFIPGPTIFNQIDCSAPRALGYSSYILNQVTSDVKQRFTFVFLDVIQRLHAHPCWVDPANFNIAYPIENVVTLVLTHELGHQRAGLTHPNEPGHSEYAGNYHGGSLPRGRIDVMWLRLQNSELGQRAGVFDKFSQIDPFCSQATCANNLYCRRNIT
jgi:hypothetical protein